MQTGKCCDQPIITHKLLENQCPFPLLPLQFLLPNTPPRQRLWVPAEPQKSVVARLSGNPRPGSELPHPTSSSRRTVCVFGREPGPGLEKSQEMHQSPALRKENTSPSRFVSAWQAINQQGKRLGSAGGASFSGPSYPCTSCSHNSLAELWGCEWRKEQRAQPQTERELQLNGREAERFSLRLRQCREGNIEHTPVT